MKIVPLSPNQYHQKKFDVTKLPDVAKAGPVSASILSKARNPLVFLQQQDLEGTSKAMDWGTLVDCLWLTPEDYNNQCISLPADAPKDLRCHRNAAKPSQSTLDSIAFWDNFERRAIGKVIVTDKMLSDAKIAVQMLKDHPLASELWADSKKQVAFMGELIPGTISKCLMDLLPLNKFSDSVADFKTRYDVSERGMANAIFDFEYHMKMGFYSLVAEMAGLGKREKGYLIFQRSKFPFDVHVREIDPKDMDIGKQLALVRFNSLFDMSARDLKPFFDKELRKVSLQDWQRDRNLREIHGEYVVPESPDEDCVNESEES